jgi:hypothetical protein
MYTDRKAFFTKSVVCKGVLIMEKDLFSITLTSKGIYWLKKLNPLAKFLFLLSILITIAGLINFYLRMRYFSLEFTRIAVIRNQVLASRIYGILFHLLFPFQVYFYYQFARESEIVIADQNAEGFNDTFRYLYLNAALSIISFLLNAFYILFQTYTDWIIIHKAFRTDS